MCIRELREFHAVNKSSYAAFRKVNYVWLSGTFCARLAVCSAVAVMAAVASSTPRRFTKREGVVSLMAPRIADVYWRGNLRASDRDTHIYSLRQKLTHPVNQSNETCFACGFKAVIF